MPVYPRSVPTAARQGLPRGVGLPPRVGQGRRQAGTGRSAPPSRRCETSAGPCECRSRTTLATPSPRCNVTCSVQAVHPAVGGRVGGRARENGQYLSGCRQGSGGISALLHTHAYIHYTHAHTHICMHAYKNIHAENIGGTSDDAEKLCMRRPHRGSRALRRREGH